MPTKEQELENRLQALETEFREAKSKATEAENRVAEATRKAEAANRDKDALQSKIKAREHDRICRAIVILVVFLAAVTGLFYAGMTVKSNTNNETVRAYAITGIAACGVFVALACFEAAKYRGDD